MEETMRRARQRKKRSSADPTTRAPTTDLRDQEQYAFKGHRRLALTLHKYVSLRERQELSTLACWNDSQLCILALAVSWKGARGDDYFDYPA